MATFQSHLLWVIHETYFCSVNPRLNSGPNRIFAVKKEFFYLEQLDLQIWKVREIRAYGFAECDGLPSHHLLTIRIGDSFFGEGQSREKPLKIAVAGLSGQFVPGEAKGRHMPAQHLLDGDLHLLAVATRASNTDFVLPWPDRDEAQL